MKKNLLQEGIIPAINYHLWSKCNMNCKFCFGQFKTTSHDRMLSGKMSKKESLQLVQMLIDYGFEKITFSGGEPTLCPWLPDLLKLSKQSGLVTCVVTNGSQITTNWLEKNHPYLDWIAFSIDAIDSDVNIRSGRCLASDVKQDEHYYMQRIKLIKEYDVKLKINTVASKYNMHVDLNDFISRVRPHRWKVFQALPIANENQAYSSEFCISLKEFNAFKNKHHEALKATCIVSESNYQMTNSYLMVNPHGCFFDNTNGKLNYGSPILKVGVEQAMGECLYSVKKFIQRGGIYDWKSENKIENRPKKITLSGGVASGKSTVGKILAERLDYSFKSIGQKTRQIAEQRGLTILEFQQECLNNPELDKEIDREFSNECNAATDLVIDYRLGFKFINSSFNIYLKVSDDTALSRLKKANRKNETYHTLHDRNDCFVQQFKNTYNIDFTKEDQYDLVLDVDDMAPDEIVDRILIEM